MEEGQTDRSRRALAAIRRSARVARSRGVPAVPLREAREHLMAMFDDPLELAEVIACYDDLEDVIVFNPSHEAWGDIESYLRARPRLFSTLHPHQIVRHEVGHASHFRLLTPEERTRIWHADLNPQEREIARRVSGRATWNVKEFIAEAHAGLWAKVEYDREVLSLFDRFRGPRP
jgi:hypothetical protein